MVETTGGGPWGFFGKFFWGGGWGYCFFISKFFEKKLGGTRGGPYPHLNDITFGRRETDDIN